MRILYVADTTRLGGAERVLESLAEAAAGRGHDVAVASPQPYVLERVAALDNVRGIPMGNDRFRSAATRVRRTTGAVAQIPTLARILHRERPDVLHVNNGGHPGSPLCLLSLPLARTLGVPQRLLSIHAVPKRRGSRLEPLLDRLTWWGTTAVIGATGIVRDGLCRERSLPPALYHRIPYGVSGPARPDAGDTARRDLQLDERAALFVMVSATSEKQKGHAVFLEALRRTPSASGVVIGAAPPPEVRELLGAPELASRVRVAGRVEDVRAWIRAADAVVVPSVADESLPLIVLEAFSEGRPVIASHLSGIPEAVEDQVTGLLFPPGDVTALARALSRATADPALCRALGSNARARWEERFSIAAMTQETLALYGPEAHG